MKFLFLIVLCLYFPAAAAGGDHAATGTASQENASAGKKETAQKLALWAKDQHFQISDKRHSEFQFLFAEVGGYVSALDAYKIRMKSYDLGGDKRHLELAETQRKDFAKQCMTDNCKAYLLRDSKKCATDDCRAFFAKDPQKCGTGDCRALLSKDIKKCATADCEAYLKKDVKKCATGDCRALLSKDPKQCATADCRAYLSIYYSPDQPDYLEFYMLPVPD